MRRRPTVAIVERVPVGWLLLSWLIIIAWRFFTGAHMNGQKYFDTLFWKDAKPLHKHKQVSFNAWKRKARVKRLLWRNCVFWPIFWITYGCIVAPDTMIILAFWASPIYCYLGFYWGRKTFFELHRASFAEGQVREFWTLKRKYRWMRFEWARNMDEPSVTVRTTEDIEHGDFKIMSLQSLLNPGDDADEGG